MATKLSNIIAATFISDVSNSTTKQIKKSSLSCSLILSRLDKIDKEWSDAIHKMELGLIDILIAIPGTLFGVIGCPILALWYYNKYNSYLYPFNCFIIVVVNHSLKYIFQRQRPLKTNIGKKLLPLKKMHHDPSMPSGDTAQASVAAATMIYHGYSPAWMFIVPCSAFARVYFGSHYIGDTIFGGTFGLIAAYAINQYLNGYFS